ncbi:sorbosone dehydrogenase family protein [Sphingomonas sp. CGMCC 1.13654]|uniref:Sorbosone dehydrogenase family protein n=1 Tax=Sphingomonas chungangi TaxID=2683589 RepID=A0A838LA38_9SPHN|nr:sorbosone dehydrogenase family protein [Sphingomonas chungangi]MBA2934368.1 sorbosone dehydrogenase family protein [Sphingomonas chungangi]MVW57407.1 sorbosone dehydrogenase family protein [Sphingomonas chungangi]
MSRLDSIVRNGSTLLAVTLILAAAGCHKQVASPDTQIGPNPALPEPNEYLLPPMKTATSKPWTNGEMPTAGPGLKVQPFATGLIHPRSVFVLPNGDVLVAQSDGPKPPVNRPKDVVMGLIQAHAKSFGPKAPNNILLLRDTNGDGIADQRFSFLEGRHSPFGMALVGNDLYIADTDALIRYHYTPGQTKMTDPGVKVTDLPGGPIDHHWTKSLTASADGTKLYVGVGSNSNIAENGMVAEGERAAIWEVDRVTGAHRLYATGTRNPVGLAVEPTSHVLWAVVNERDELGPNLVPDYLTSIRDGGFYGWPYSYWGQHIDPRVMPQRPDLVAKAIVPDYGLSSHVAPLGVTFSTGNAIPAQYRGGAFIGEHGSWDRDPFNGYKVIYVPFAGGRPSGKPVDVLSGFLTDGKTAHGRPVGLATDAQGAVLVADDLGNAVWRISGR